jgi:hypothetical protein
MCLVSKRLILFLCLSELESTLGLSLREFELNLIVINVCLILKRNFSFVDALFL